MAIVLQGPSSRPWMDRHAWLSGPQVIFNVASVLPGLRISGTLLLSGLPRGGEGAGKCINDFYLFQDNINFPSAVRSRAWTWILDRMVGPNG